MSGRVANAMRRSFRFVRSFFGKQVLAAGRSLDVEAMPAVTVVQLNGRKRLDAPTVNYSFGSLHRILDAALGAIFVRDRAPRSVLVLGLGAGSIVALLRRRHGVRAPIVGVEHDPEVLRLAREHFGLGGWSDLEIVVADAAAFVARDARQFDLVVVDLFVDSAVPASCCTPEFLANVRERLSPGGLLLWNVIADAPAGRAMMPRFVIDLATVFPDARTMSIAGNVVFAAERPAGAHDPVRR